MKVKAVLFFMCFLAVFTSMAQSMKVVVNSRGEILGKYLGENRSTYTIGVQDDWEIPKQGARVVTFSAAAGQGVVFPNVGVARKGPGKKYGVVKFEIDGPMSFPCLGKENGWYKVRINGKVAYMNESQCYWEAFNAELWDIDDRIKKHCQQNGKR